MCSGSDAGSYLRLLDFVYHSTLGLRVIKKRRSRDIADRPYGGSGSVGSMCGGRDGVNKGLHRREFRLPAETGVGERALHYRGTLLIRNRPLP